MKNDAHLYESEIPLLEGQTYLGLCGKEIPRAKYVMGWDRLEVGAKRQLLKSLDGCCRKCKERFEVLQCLATDDWIRRHFVYAIRSARKDEEENLEAA
jgi:hypothetical protein